MKIFAQQRNKIYLCTPFFKGLNTLRGGAEVARWAHNPKVVSSNLAPATTKPHTKVWGFLFCTGCKLICDPEQNKKDQNPKGWGLVVKPSPCRSSTERS